MGLFDHLSALEVKDRRAWLSVPRLGHDAALLLSPANDANEPYWVAQQDWADRHRGLLDGAGQSTLRTTNQLRDRDRDLYPLYIVHDWRGIHDAAGATVPFTPQNCAELIRKLPFWVFDEIRLWALRYQNFLSPGEAPPADAATIAKNSASASSSS